MCLLVVAVIIVVVVGSGGGGDGGGGCCCVSVSNRLWVIGSRDSLYLRLFRGMSQVGSPPEYSTSSAAQPTCRRTLVVQSP